MKLAEIGPIDLLTDALTLLADESVHCEQNSSWYGSAAFPAGSGPDFVNAVAKIKTDLSPTALLDALHRVESALGRERGVRWAARSCDLDLLAYEDQVLPNLSTYTQWQDLSPDKQMTSTPTELILPHPRLSDRAFVLIPMAEIAPDWHHPVSGIPVNQLISQLPTELRQTVWKL